MQFLKAMWVLLCYPVRKRQLSQALKQTIERELISHSTAYLYVDMWGHHGAAYAKRQLKRAILDMAADMYLQAGLPDEFRRLELPTLIDLRFSKLELIDISQGDGIKDAYLFGQPTYYPGRHVVILSGDTAMNQLHTRPAEQMIWTDLLFNIIGAKASTEVPTRIFADACRIVNVFALKNNIKTPSYSDTSATTH